MRSLKVLNNSLISLLIFAGASTALAAGDMLTPDEVQTTGIEANPANDSGMFLGAGLSVGQATSTEPGSSSGLATFVTIEPGYQRRSGSFGRLEMSAEFLFGKSSFRLGDGDGKVDLPVGFGVLAKFGYGYSLGGKAFGIAKVGLGPLMGKYEGHPKGAGKITSDTVSGLAGMIGWTAVVPISDSLDFTGGISYTHMAFGVSKVKDSGGTSYDLNRSVQVNVASADLGLRLRF